MRETTIATRTASWRPPRSAGVKRIDYLVITHYHGDHAGGVPQLAAKIPIGKIFDHGDSFEKSNAKTQAVFQPYAALRENYPHASTSARRYGSDQRSEGRSRRGRGRRHSNAVAGRRQLGNLGKNTITGPGTNNWDMSLYRKIPFTERFWASFASKLTIPSTTRNLVP